MSCICPTYNRPQWIARAVECFLAQDYPQRELIIIDDGAQPDSHLLTADPRIRYHRLERRLSIGAKRNRACELARGELIAHWDDDDWYPPWRLSRQVEALFSAGAEISGTSQLYYFDRAANRAFHYVYADSGPWVAGNTFVYRKSFWQRSRFADLQIGEDSRFLGTVSRDKIVDLKDARLCVASIHAQNTSPKDCSGPWWRTVRLAEVQQILDQHRDGRTAVLSRSPNHRIASHCRHRAALEGDLNLPEFAAFNYGQNLPPMRRWELPWTLFAARLGNTTSVLDCTINPVNLSECIARLYPHVQYRHVNPAQHGVFQLPLGVPDESFDRVFCINTLEHLVREERDALVADLTRKLKPGGLLLLTSDYYFDSSWSNPAFLNAGVMRPEGGDLFGGWNKIRIKDWNTPCRANGLIPMDPDGYEDPQEYDPSYLRNPDPFSHGTIAGVFSKGPPAEATRKRILLALLTWNTRDISVDSVKAYLTEARMLARLGCEPYICVCDNGSTDNTQEALRALEPEIDIPYKLILNGENLGNSVARNQIIDYMLECGADYLLFMDGDIEIVPFSSFAMFRHMENNGHRLGCIGADFRGQSPVRAHTTPSLYSIDGLGPEEVDWVAWTQYGMFRRAVFEQGVRFDESEPFKGAGWGFEDNDLAFQMVVRGFRIQFFPGMVYLHRAVRSSVRIMRKLGHDPGPLYDKRKAYVVSKWESVPQIDQGPLMLVRRVQMQL